MGWWKLNGNVKDSTPYQRNVTIDGSPQLSADRLGKADSAYHFNGSSDYLSFGTGADYDYASFSISIWAKADSPTQTHVKNLIGKGNWNSTNNWYMGFKNGTTLSFVYGTTWGAGPQYALSNFDVTQWHHYVGVVTPTTESLYLDGQQVDSKTISHTAVTNTFDMQIARSSYYGNMFAGTIDDTRIYNRALTTDEITALHDQHDADLQVAGSESGLIGHWKLNGNAKDSTPYSDNGTVDGAILASDRSNNTDGAYAFDGSAWQKINALITATTYPGLTLSAWIYPTAYPSERSTIIEGLLPNSYYLSLNSDGSLQTYWYGRNPVGYFSSGADIVPLNQWSLVTVTWSNTQAKLYVNGALKTTTGTTGTGLVPTALVFGAETGSRQFRGKLDDLRIYNKAISDETAANLYTVSDTEIGLSNAAASSGGVSLQNGLVGYWPFNGNAKDTTVYQNDATASNATLAPDRWGHSDSAYSLTGATTSYLSAPRGSPQQPTQAISLSFWAQISGNGANAPRAIMVSVDTTYVDACFSGNILFSLYLTTGQKLITGGSCPVIGTWHMYTVTYDGSVARVYVDGALVGSATYSDPIQQDNSFIYFGRYNNGGYTTQGTLDDIRLYDRALNQQEITALYNAVY